MPGVVFVEEPSAEQLIRAIARRVGVEQSLQVIPHEGKKDLERSFARKIGAWRHPPDVRFIVARDNDGGDCVALKARLQSMIPADRLARTRIRIVMQELESWYVGDLPALVAAGLLQPGQAARFTRGASYRQPDAVGHPARAIKELVGSRGKIELARLVGPHMSVDDNRSVSFKHFVSALRWAGA